MKWEQDLTEKWNVEVNCCPDDWGVGFAWPK